MIQPCVRGMKYEDKLSVCLNCKVKYGNKYFSKHKCMVDQPEPVLLSNQTNEDTEF